MPPRRSADDGPLATLFMLALLIAITAGGLWYSVREKTNRGTRSPDPGRESAGQSRPRSGSPNSHGFVDAFKRLPNDATALQQSADEEFDNTARLLGADELAQVQKIMSRNGSSRDDYSESELATLRRHGFGKWVRAQAIRWSHSDPTFETVVAAVWERSPQAREDRDLTELAVKWGEKSRSARQRLLSIIQSMEGNSRELTADERNEVIAFAGEEFLARRP